MFNAIKHMEYLVDHGYSPDQAKASVITTVEIMDEKYVTKEQLNEVILTIKDDMKTIVHKMEQMESNLTIKLGKMLFTGISILGIILGILIKTS